MPLTMTFDEVKAQGTWHQENDFHSKLGQPDNCAKEEDAEEEEEEEEWVLRRRQRASAGHNAR